MRCLISVVPRFSGTSAADAGDRYFHPTQSASPPTQPRPERQLSMLSSLQLRARAWVVVLFGMTGFQD